MQGAAAYRSYQAHAFDPKLNTFALYPSRSKLRGITFKIKTELYKISFHSAGCTYQNEFEIAQGTWPRKEYGN
jgi:hypothetical protein